MMTPRYNDFLGFATLRHDIWRKRQRGEPKPWTSDPILQKYSFTNVFRELDKTTVWYARNVRERFNGTPLVFMATVLFRWLNRIESGEVLFNQQDVEYGSDIGTAYLRGLAPAPQLIAALRTALGDGPYTTGAYIITSPKGMDKLTGVIHCVERLKRREYKYWKDGQFAFKSLQETWHEIKDELHMGPFMAYEVVTDLYHTYLLQDAPDIMTWCNPGPGAKRGLLRLYEGNEAVTDRHVPIPWRPQQCIAMIQKLMTEINTSPGYRGDFWGKPCWDMRDVEHTLCEFDKYERVRTGLGVPRNKYPGT